MCPYVVFFMCSCIAGTVHARPVNVPSAALHRWHTGAKEGNTSDISCTAYCNGNRTPAPGTSFPLFTCLGEFKLVRLCTNAASLLILHLSCLPLAIPLAVHAAAAVGCCIKAAICASANPQRCSICHSRPMKACGLKVANLMWEVPAELRQSGEGSRGARQHTLPGVLFCDA
jgi:hypothetical protein